jgi:hypothetical protein
MRGHRGIDIVGVQRARPEREAAAQVLGRDKAQDRESGARPGPLAAAEVEFVERNAGTLEHAPPAGRVRRICLGVGQTIAKLGVLRLERAQPRPQRTIVGTAHALIGVTNALRGGKRPKFRS